MNGDMYLIWMNGLDLTCAAQTATKLVFLPLATSSCALRETLLHFITSLSALKQVRTHVSNTSQEHKKTPKMSLSKVQKKS